MPTLRSDVRAVFFDAVGTLIFPNPSALVVYADVARGVGLDLPPDEVRRRFLAAYRTQENADRAAGWATSEERERTRWHAIVCETLAGVPDPDACFDALYDHFAKPAAWTVNPHAAPTINHLVDRGVVVGLGSNYDARLHSVLDGFPELAPLRDRTVVSAAVGFRKPAAEFFAEVVRLSGCDARQVAFVGDDVENDFDGARAAGLDAVLLAPRGNPDARRVIGELRELVG
ncbi:Haloacid dehalogenase superfamily enzyme, subfamily IA OS=Singulisphaera acidiphila (strain ATCC BAA-1392 / DSM 18658 / VKM B-2454 / MOB10) GN=Sinac_5298 PE=4 SV=1: HAD_2 [Gemmataceae bacterium]|nr:Haloacid dehalogenase superfamily enzyme, subfamily IA OS=Singulisphaera acidiphila (strain ATCC BAA-1392 / DSM 18658 / VKM B-2454 / MOB10) GN=Sinac_5298 PE=4 SV=1: HAD_2 [Gemmataceae bacterium]VTT99975.1 Haloacid dehalogenase superfamily enzyme, subfamily IA OS=Singulisphaera acidiphila (strain ATCC BAA-1392 / DSM 18658 / VKM B-2454 / MOB10) GN=Sinac_5298 PE=4 SV=1: HAD_2 [Gemmataceae bacterium]